MLNKKALAATAAGAEALYVEDVFSTYLYTGNGSTQTITNGIDLAGEGGLVWLKNRGAAGNHFLADSERSTFDSSLASNLTNAASSVSTIDVSSTGFSLTGTNFNGSGATFASWTFRKAEKFFDVVTYTGNGTTQAINHNLGSTPGCVIIKKTSSASSDGWPVFHRSLTASYRLLLNSTAGRSSGQEELWFGNNSTSVAPTSTQFTVGSKSDVNGSGETYVAYLFAHDAGGFGDAGDQSVIKCGSYTGNGSATGPTITLDWEPQWVLIKQSTQSGTRWTVTDNMRGFPASSSGQNILQPHVTDAEVGVAYIQPTSTGFKVVDVDGDVNTSGETYVYIAIRRGPMKTPEAGTSVFTPTARTGTGASATFTGAGFPVDSSWIRFRGSLEGTYIQDRLRGPNRVLDTTATSSESTQTQYITAFDSMTGYTLGTNSGVNGSSSTYINWDLRRAPGFFDVVCYTGTGSATTVTHNLGVAPELIIAKKRDAAGDSWAVYAAPLTSSYYLLLNSTQAATSNTSRWTSTAPSSTIFRVGTDGDTNDSGAKYVAYLFASCPGVSKIGTVTVASSAINVDCGFTSSARFVLLKRTSDASGWIVFDSARGIVAGDDPYLYINSTAAENSDGASDIIDTYSSGFTLPAGGLSGITGEGTYLYLAIA